MSQKMRPSSLSPPYSDDEFIHEYRSDNLVSSSETITDFTSPSCLSPSSNGSSDGFDVDIDGCYTDVSSKRISRVTRHQRNIAEKQRRDKLNRWLSSLASMVPWISMSTKRVNKSGILRLTASYLRLHQNLFNGLAKQSEWRPLFLTGDELASLLLESMEGFLVIIDQSARILFVSEGIEKFLGHSVVDILGQHLSSFIHPHDQPLLEDKLTQLFSANCSDSEDAEPPACSFFCSMLQNICDGRTGCIPSYELTQVVGRLKVIPSDCLQEIPNENPEPAKMEKVFVGVVKHCSTMPWQHIFVNTNSNELVFRGAPNGRLLYVDQRVSQILGVLPSEVIGSSGYGIIVQDDFPLAAMAHMQMLTDGYFHRLPTRLFTCTKTMIHVISNGKFVSSTEGGDIDTLFIQSTVVSNEEGEKALAMAKHRLTPFIGKFDFRSLWEMVKSGGAGSDITMFEGTDAMFFPNTDASPPKRPRGRPRKHPLMTATVKLPNGLDTHKKKEQSPINSSDNNIQKWPQEYSFTYDQNSSVWPEVATLTSAEADIYANDSHMER